MSPESQIPSHYIVKKVKWAHFHSPRDKVKKKNRFGCDGHILRGGGGGGGGQQDQGSRVAAPGWPDLTSPSLDV